MKGGEGRGGRKLEDGRIKVRVSVQVSKRQLQRLLIQWCSIFHVRNHLSPFKCEKWNDTIFQQQQYLQQLVPKLQLVLVCDAASRHLGDKDATVLPSNDGDAQWLRPFVYGHSARLLQMWSGDTRIIIIFIIIFWPGTQLGGHSDSHFNKTSTETDFFYFFVQMFPHKLLVACSYTNSLFVVNSCLLSGDRVLARLGVKTLQVRTSSARI